MGVKTLIVGLKLQFTVAAVYPGTQSFLSVDLWRND